MASNVAPHYVQDFSRQIDYWIASQTTSKFRDKVEVKTGCFGEQVQLKTLETVEMETKSTQYAEVTGGVITHDSRWIYPEVFEKTLWFDDEDMLKSGMDPSSGYARRLGEAYQRKLDAVIIGDVGSVGGLIGTANTGKTGSSTETLSGVSRVVTASSGLTWGKLVETLELFNSANVDPEEPKFLAITPKALTDLLDDNGPKYSDSTANTAVNRWGDADSVALEAVRTGKMSMLAGFNIFLCNHKNLLSTAEGGLAGSSTNRCIAFTRDALKLGMWKDMMLNLDQLPSRGYTYQFYMKAMMGSVRQDYRKVALINVTV